MTDDIVTRLSDAVPYGLEDYTVLRDAITEIKYLRDLRALADKPTFKVEMFPGWWWRWNFIVVWSNGIYARSTKSSWGYGRTYARACVYAQEARRG